jgi:hypothetical protein
VDDLSEKELTMEADLREEHKWLQRLVGEWVFESEPVGTDETMQGMTGTESVRLLGEAWAICEMQTGAPGADEGSNIMTLGYDSDRERFVGTFVSSMMTHLWVYEGKLDESGRSLLLDTEGPSYTGDEGRFKYRDRIDLLDQGERVLSSSMLAPDGQWQEFMRMRYRKTSSP